MLTRAEQSIYDSMQQNIVAQPDEAAVRFMVRGLGEHMRLLNGTTGDGFNAMAGQFSIPGIANERLLGQRDYLTSESWWHGPMTISIPREVLTEVSETVEARIPFTPFTKSKEVTKTLVSHEYDYAPATCVDVTTQKQEDAAKVLYRFDPYPPLYVHLPKDKAELPAYYDDFDRFGIDIRLGMAATVPLRLAESFHDIALEKPAVVRQLAAAVIQPVSDKIGASGVDDFRVYPNLPDEWPIHIGVPGEARHTYQSDYVTIGKQVEA